MVVLERLALLAPTPSEIVDKVISVVLGKAQRAIARPLTHPGGVRVAAAMLNAMNKEASKNILTTLEESNPDLGNSIKQEDVYIRGFDLPRCSGCAENSS